MKIKKFEAQTEQAAIELVRDELGMDAIVLNIKKIQPKGIFAIFRKPIVEITAAYEERAVNAASADPKPKTVAQTIENQIQEIPEALAATSTPAAVIDISGKAKPKTGDKKKEIPKGSQHLELMPNTAGAKENANLNTNETAENPAVEKMRHDMMEKQELFGDELTYIMKEITISEQQVKIRDLENQLQSSEQALSRMSRQLISSAQKAKNGQSKYNTKIVQMFYDTLTEQGVISEVAEYILDEIDLVSDIDEIDINIIVKIVYNSIIEILQRPDPPEPGRADKKSSVYAFIGPTGVGKTTTIAKLAAEFMLNRELRVGLITADTYRIAAVEQLKLYGDILGIEVCVVYNTKDMANYIETLGAANDVILVDTAGRSHKNSEMLEELESLMSAAPDCEVFLVLSLTTKYDDLISIIEIYSKITDFRIIFTKKDETNQLGTILNIVYKTGKKVAYITNGQNVPQDFEVMRPDKIARVLLGLGEE